MCGERLDAFLALGENGQPVHSAALQLLETLKRKHHVACANCLAIPQPNEAGDHIDWYAPMAGEVTAWSAASSEQREQALAMLEQCQRILEQVSAQMSIAQTQGQKLFGALLGKVMNFPSDDYVYLVDGQPVITFWGFVKAGHKPQSAPLKALSLAPLPRPTPEPVPTAAPLSEPASDMPLPKSAPISESPVTRTGFNWRWLWWLLLFLILIPLLLWGLRGCQHLPWTNHALPISAPTMPKTSFSATPSAPPVTVVSPALRTAEPTGPGMAPDLALSNVSTPVPVVAGPALGSAIEVADPVRFSSAPTISDPASISPERLPPVAMRVDEPSVSEGINEPHLSPYTPTALADAYPDLATHPLALDALNGRWSVGLGIQDARTGRPLTLDYRFKHGQGTVTLDKGSNVRCEGEVQAMAGQGALMISKQPLMRCSDDSRYETPAVHCTQGTASALSCLGRYDDGALIRMTMTREGE